MKHSRSVLVSPGAACTVCGLASALNVPAPMPLPADEPLLYEDLAARLETMIARGALRAGHRMPSVRHLSKQEGVSASTVVQAYALLENRGAIEVRPRSGHYVRRPRGPIEAPRPARASTTSARVSIEDQVMRVYRAVRDPSIVPLGAATRDRSSCRRRGSTASSRRSRALRAASAWATIRRRAVRRFAAPSRGCRSIGARPFRPRTSSRRRAPWRRSTCACAPSRKQETP